MGTFKLATSEDFDLAIYGDFLMATDTEVIAGFAVTTASLA